MEEAGWAPSDDVRQRKLKGQSLGAASRELRKASAAAAREEFGGAVMGDGGERGRGEPR